MGLNCASDLTPRHIDIAQKESNIKNKPRARGQPSQIDDRATRLWRRRDPRRRQWRSHLHFEGWQQQKKYFFFSSFLFCKWR